MNRYPHRTLFWPALLILVGLVALLVNTGRLGADRLYLLFNLWPLILIVIGLELIIRRSVRGPMSELAAGLVAVLAIAGALVYVTVAPAVSTATASFDSSATASNVQQASVEVDVGAATIAIGASNDLGGDLYRAHIDYSGPKPAVTLDRSSGTLKISQDTHGFYPFQAYKIVLDLELNPNVSWSITENSGAASDNLSLAGVNLRSMTLNTGASREDITLGSPSRPVSITINGGALTVHVHRPSGVPVSIAVSGGAVTLDADGRHHGAIGNVSYQSPDYASGSSGYSVAVNGGACTVTLDTSTPS